MPNITSRGFTPSTYDPASKTFVATVATEQPATVWDWERFDVIREVLLMQGATWPDIGQAPLLDAHSRDSTQKILGSARNFRVVGDELHADVHLVDGPQGEAIGRKIKGGHLTDLSVGYQVEEYRDIHDGEVQIINGVEHKGPLRVATKWKIFEVSLTPIGADSRAKVRSFPMDTQTTAGKPDVTQTQTRGNVDPVMAERERVSTITQKCIQAGLPEHARHYIENGASVAEATDGIFQHMARKAPPIVARHFDDDAYFQAGATEGQKRNEAQVDGLLLRTGTALDKPAAGANEFRNMSILDHARNCLNMNGINPRVLGASEVITKAMSTRSMWTTSDFPSLLSGYASKLLRTAYEMSPGTFDQWTVKGSGENFKDLHRVQLSEAPDLDLVNEAAEYQYGSLADHQETFRIKKYGKLLRMSWESLINDDLSGFQRTAKAFVQSAKRGLNQAVYALLASNPTMSDTERLFSVAHANLADSGAAPDITTLSAARLAMRMQTGSNSSYPLNIEPAFMVVPAALETDGMQLLNTPSGYDATDGVGISNPFYKAMTLIADPALDGFSDQAWYLVADPKRFDTIEVAYLEGRDHPYLEEEWGFEVDSWAIKVRFCYGLGILDHRGMFKNPGSSGD